jgi:type II secretory pathway pseudopilin PulG
MNKNGFELSISMLIIIILGVVILGIGFTIFAQAQTKISSAQEEVSSQAQRQLEALLIDTSAPVVVPFSLISSSRGDQVIFNLGLSNELGKTATFRLNYSFGSSTHDGFEDDFSISDWVMVFPEYEKGFSLLSKEHQYIPILIDIPRSAPKGQHGLLVRVEYYENNVWELYGSAQMLYVVI